MKQQSRLGDYVINGKCFMHDGGHDHDRITHVEDVHREITEQEAKKRLSKTAEYYAWVRNKFDHKPAYHTIELKLMLGDKQIAEVHLVYESRIIHSTVKRGRGWISKDRWKSENKIRKLSRGRVENVSVTSYF